MASRPGLGGRAIREARDRFPVWFGAWLAMGHVLTALAFLEPPRWSALATAALPLLWVGAYYLVRPPVDRAVVAVLVLAAPLMALLCWLPAWLMYDGAHVETLKFSFEVLAPLWATALALHCKRDRGWPGVVLFFGLGAVYGFVLETTGIVLGYFSESGYRIYVPLAPTPLSSVAGWCTIFYPAVYVADAFADRFPAVRRGVLWSAAIVTLVAVSADLHFDPIATAVGMWVWDPRLPPVYLGVPLVNFTSWFAAVFAAALAYYVIERRAWRGSALRIASIVGLAAALGLAAAVNLFLTGVLEGPRGPSWSLLRDALRSPGRQVDEKAR